MDTMPKLDSNVLRAAGVALISLIALLVHMIWSSVSVETVQTQGAQILDAALAVVSTGSVLWAIVARIRLPNPPLSQSAADAHTAILAKQGLQIAPAGAPADPLAATKSVTGATTALVAFLVPMLLLLAGCQLLAPQSIDSKLFAANQVLTSVELGTDQALRAGLITAVQARSVSTIAHQVNPLIDSVRAAEAANNPTAANQTMNLITSLLAGLQAYVPAGTQDPRAAAFMSMPQPTSSAPK